MLHSVHDMNPTRMNTVAAALQDLQDNPQALDFDRNRFDDSPPPYHSAGSTVPPSPTFPVRHTPRETAEILGEPLNNTELHLLRQKFQGYLVSHPFKIDSAKVDRQMSLAFSARDSNNKPLYRGPDFIGRPGFQRLKVMTRNCVRKKWEALGVWNPTWGIPGRASASHKDDSDWWQWKWPNAREVRGDYHKLPWKTQQESWPPEDEEFPSERAIRLYLEGQGLLPRTHAQPTPTNPDSNEFFITSRPWYRWSLEIEEEELKLRRLREPARFRTTTAVRNVRARWEMKGTWKDSWHNTPGWKWKHESPSPEPEDLNDLDYSPSEVDALESIPPPTPPKPLRLRTPTSEERRLGDLIFGDLRPHRDPEQSSLTQSGREQGNEDGTSDGPSEVDALESIPPPTPPKPIRLRTPTEEESRQAALIFGHLKPYKEPEQSSPTQSGREQGNEDGTSDGPSEADTLESIPPPPVPKMLPFQLPAEEELQGVSPLFGNLGRHGGPEQSSLTQSGRDQGQEDGTCDDPSEADALGSIPPPPLPETIHFGMPVEWGFDPLFGDLGRHGGPEQSSSTPSGRDQGKEDGGSDGISDGGPDGGSDGISDGISDGGPDGGSDGISDGSSVGSSDVIVVAIPCRKRKRPEDQNALEGNSSSIPPDELPETPRQKRSRTAKPAPRRSSRKKAPRTATPPPRQPRGKKAPRNANRAPRQAPQKKAPPKKAPPKKAPRTSNPAPRRRSGKKASRTANPAPRQAVGMKAPRNAKSNKHGSNLRRSPRLAQLPAVSYPK